MLTILYFAWVRERIGIESERVMPPDEIDSAGTLAAWLSKRSEGHAAAFADMTRVRVAIDQQFAALDGTIAGASEIAFFPPVTGG